LVGLTPQLAHALGPCGITGNSVAPGFVRSNAASERQWAGYGEEGQRALVDRIAMKRLGAAHDIANSVVVFAPELAGFVNGQVLAADKEKKPYPPFILDC
jgi:3-oxoacyl-[acyl-carrier protein] reductase